MAFLRKPCRDNLTMGVVYSCFQKCIRRGLLEESIYYGTVIFEDGTPNALRKRLCLITLEDTCRLDVACDMMNAQDNELLDYVQILVHLKKTHISAWAQRLVLENLLFKGTIELTEELLKIEELMVLMLDKKNKQIRDLLNAQRKGYGKLYTFTNKSRLVLSSYILSERKELQYTIDSRIRDVDGRKFDTIPFWVFDKHVSGGVKGYEFFIKEGLKSVNTLYDFEKEDYRVMCVEIYLRSEVKSGKVVEELQKETFEGFEGYTNVIQIQLLTRRNHPKVYFATDVINGQKLVIKGPLTTTEVKTISWSEGLKRTLGENELNFKIVTIGGKQYMITDSIVDYETCTSEWKESKLECSRIYTGKKAEFSWDVLCNCTHIWGFVKAYLLKLLLGANDFASRNFIIDSNNKVYSVDDASYHTQPVVLRGLKKVSVNQSVCDYIRDNNDLFNILMDQWEMLIDDNLKGRVSQLKMLFQ